MACSNDLRVKLLEAYKAGAGNLRRLATQLRVSWGYSKKIRMQQLHSGEKRHPLQRRQGPASRITAEAQEQVCNSVREQSDLTEVELSERLSGIGVSVSRSRVRRLLRQMGLRRKKIPARGGAGHGCHPQAAGKVPRGHCCRYRGEAEVPGRKRRDHADAPAMGTSPTRRTCAQGYAGRPLASTDYAGGHESVRHGGGDDGCFRHRWRRLLRLYRAGVVRAVTIRRCCGDGQSERVQGCRYPAVDRGPWRTAALSSPYSPDLNSIEKAWSKFKQFLRSAKARTAEALDHAITQALKTITGENAAAWFRSCACQDGATVALLQNPIDFAGLTVRDSPNGWVPRPCPFTAANYSGHP